MTAVGKCVPVKWHWPEHTPRGASFHLSPHPMVMPLQGALKAVFLPYVFLSPFSCLHPYIWEFVDISSISVLISWDFLAWPYHTFFNILGTNSISWGKICERQKTKRRRLKNSVLLKYGNSWNIMVNSLKRNHNGLAGFLNRTNPSYYTGFDRSNKSSHINSAETGSPFGQW